MNDPIVDEVRRVRDAQDIKQREKRGGLEFVQGVAHQPMPNQTPRAQPEPPPTPVTPRP